MAAHTSLTPNEYSSETQAWQSLRRAIATSSGFQRWLQQASQDAPHLQHESTDQLVVQYLRETLETLAY